MRYVTELSWAQLAAMDPKKTLLVMPIASVEQHGMHLPVGTDYLLMEKFAAALAEASLPGFEGLVLPTLQFGLNTEHARFPGTITLPQHTLADILAAQADSFHRHGFCNFVLFNSHGGNFDLLDSFIRTYRTGHDCRMMNLDYFRYDVFKGHEAWIENPVGLDIHAGEFETSLMMHLYPELVDMDVEAAALDECNVKAAQLPCGWLTHEVSRFGVMGNAALATAAKGAAYYEIICRFVADMLERFCQECGG